MPHIAIRIIDTCIMHYQNKVIATFQIHLLEAADLPRNYWSALAVGPVNLLGLSKAHGPVSSFVSFSLDHHQSTNPASLFCFSHYSS
jgi:hypothetical protein